MGALILAEGLGKSYGGRRLFDDAAFQVEAGDRVAVVGPNGAGKTTLLRLLAGQERPDHGTLRLAPVRSHWFDQHPKFAPDAVARSLLTPPPPPAVAKELAELEARIADPALYEQPGYEAVLERYAELERQARRAEPTDPAMLRQLDVTHLDQRMSSLSGGERTRLFLARVLGAARPGDLLVLDEPTNHLDVDAIEWLEEWLAAFQGTLLVVAHDRVFLDNVATRVFEVAQGRLTTYTGNYEDYVQARDEQREREQREHQKAQERVQQAKATIQQFRHQKRFDGQYASRMKALDKYKAALQRTPDPVLARLGFGLKFDAVQKSSEEVFRFTGLTKAFEGRPVLDGAELELRKGDRVGLVGANGSGKSTLLKILTGKLARDEGSIHVAPGVKGIFFNQEQDDLQPGRTLHEEVLEARPGLDERDVKALLGRFRFDPESRRVVATLSGGERQRLMLLKCVLKPSNLLILDEPTNHLDLWAREVVVDALNAYPGTLLVVSHDRFLLDAVTEKTAVLEGGRLHVYPGSFTETRDQHRHRTATRRSDRYVVRKRFTDWTTNTKYAPGAEVELSEAQVEGSMTLRNALGQGWLERLS